MKTLRLVAVVLVVLAFPALAHAGPKVSIFYYPWYGNPALDGGWEHWFLPGGSTLDVASSYYPARGLYSSSSERVVRAQMQEIVAAGVQEVVASWWGWGSPEDLRLPLVIREAHDAGLTVAAHIEPYDLRTLETIEADIVHLQTLGITRFYVYRPFDFEPADWARLRKRLAGVCEVQLFAETALPGKAVAAGFDGIYTYDILTYGGDQIPRICGSAHRAGILCLPSVGPGYDATRTRETDLRVKSRRDGKTYDGMWRAAIRSGADVVTITSYNEWHEGTQIEPARPRPAGSAASSSFQSYDGAYGLTGRAAERAYLDRTRFWADQFVQVRRGRPQLV